MKLSVITINKDNKEGLLRTMESVCGQSYKDFEYIVVDGASTDGSVDLVRSYESRFKNYKWISEKDGGVFEAMNKGIRMAEGVYLLFLNSGDYLVDGEALKNVFEKGYEEDLLCGICRVSDKGSVVWKSMPRDHYTLDFFYHGSMAHQATFIKKSLFDKYGLYREDLKLMGDWEWFLRVIVLNDVKVRALNVEVSDYNLGGMSSAEENKSLIAKEKERVYADLHLQNVVEDYAQWDRTKDNDFIVWREMKKRVKALIGHLSK